MGPVPDALSRLHESDPPSIITPEDDNAFLLNPNHDSWFVRKFLAVTELPHKFPNWKIVDKKLYYYRPDPVISPLFPDLNEWKLVPEDNERNQIISESHDCPQSGHAGTQKTYIRLARDYYWPGSYQDVASYVKRCDVCQKCKVDQRLPPGLIGHRIVEEPWSTVSADVMGPFPPSRSSFQYILIIQDVFTKWIEITPLRSANGNLIRKALSNTVIHRWGTPRILLTDNGTEFVNSTLRSLAQEFGIFHATTPPYHPKLTL